MCSAVTPPAFPYSPSTSSRFCRDSAISLSLFYNNGAQPCRCHEAGARGSQCEPFGGQCPCKSNVIGRECSRCATGYWGFPNCRRELSCLPLCFPSTCSFASYRAEADLGNGCIFQPCNGFTCMKTAQLPAEQLSSASIASCSPGSCSPKRSPFSAPSSLRLRDTSLRRSDGAVHLPSAYPEARVCCLRAPDLRLPPPHRLRGLQLLSARCAGADGARLRCGQRAVQVREPCPGTGLTWQHPWFLLE